MIKNEAHFQNENLKNELVKKINSKTKPLGALGKLEELAIQIGLIQNSLSPVLANPVIVVFAGDHGVAAEGVSAYPQEVTYQMVMNFLKGGAAINVFCEQNNIKLKIVDAGVNYDFPTGGALIPLKVRQGTRNFRCEAAMTHEELELALKYGGTIARSVHKEGSNIIGFGEMGIGNTSAASAIMSLICDIPVADCVGKGAGLLSEEVQRKAVVIEDAIKIHAITNDPLKVLQVFGGYEIAQMTGGILSAVEEGMIVMIDGFISTVAFLVAYQMKPSIIDNAIFCHCSNEHAHKHLLDFLGVSPLLNLDMRLGEGTGCAVAYPIIKSAVTFLDKMASFESAAVSGKNNHD